MEQIWGGKIIYFRRSIYLSIYLSIYVYMCVYACVCVCECIRISFTDFKKNVYVFDNFEDNLVFVSTSKKDVMLQIFLKNL